MTRLRSLVMVAFVFSGGAALIFEVALQREITRAFGVSAYASATVLAAYMAGLALGAVLFGRLADRTRSPLRLYASLELGVAVCSVAMPSVVHWVVAVFSRLAHGHESDDSGVLVSRLLLAFAVTLVPTTLMGGTLPAMARALTTLGATATEEIAKLYGANLLGAFGGAALASYLIMPALGLSKSMWLAAGLYTLAAATALLLAARAPPAAASLETGASGAGAPRWVLAASAWSGLATLAAEVTWFQLLATVIGNSAFAFGLMLSVLLLGLYLGSRWVARRSGDRVDWALFGRVQLLSAAVLTATIPLWDRMPSMFVLAGPMVHSFVAAESVRALACLELMLLPAAVLGTVYPLVLRLAAKGPSLGRAVGEVAAANTIGAVLGSLLAGFLLLPAIGTRGLLVALVGGSAVLAIVTLRGRVRYAAAAVAVLALVLPSWNLARLGGGENVYFFETPYATSEVLWAHESVTSGFTSVVRNPKAGYRTLLTNGKFQGNDSGEIDAQRAFVQLPMQFVSHWDRTLLIGIGTGCSLGALSAQPWREVEAAELSFDIVDASRRFFGELNGGVLSNGRVKLHFADGRNLLLLSDLKYDLITIELSSIWFAGASELYNREFYGLARQHLAQGGIVQQWVQLHHLTRHDLAVILQSMRAELPHVVLFFDGGQGIAVGSADPLELDYPRLTELSQQLRGSKATAGIPAGDLLTLQGKLALDEAGVAELIAQEAAKAGRTPEQMASTDDNLALEYSTPRANIDPSLTVESMVESFHGLTAHPFVVRGADSDAAMAHVRAALWTGREELDKAREQLGALDPQDPLAQWLRGETRAPEAE